MSILDRSFKYRPSYATDIGRHLRKFKREAAAAKRKQAEAASPAAPAKVAAIGGRRTP